MEYWRPGWVRVAQQMDQTKTRPPRRHYLWVAAIGIALAGAGIWYGTQGRRPKLDKVILISIDTLRAANLGYDGYRRPTSPAIDRFAAQCLDFRQAYSHAPSTLPSHASMFTSVIPSVHQAHAGNRVPLADEFTTLAERFRDSGYRTAAFVEGGQMAAVWNLSQGFEVYDEPGDPKKTSRWVPDYLTRILDRAIRWIEQHQQERFFCFIHSYVVHAPYSPVPPYDRMFDEGYEGPLPFAVEPSRIEGLNDRSRNPQEPDIRHIVSLYDGEIRFMDHHVGLFLERLTELGLADHTVVVFTSDHGEEFAEHGQVGMHGHTLYDELLRVPLLIRIPGIKPRRIQRQVRLADLAPTLLALMGIDTQGEFPHGVNLLDGSDPLGPDLPVLSQRPTPDGLWVSLRYPERKIMGLDGRIFRLYRIDEDPYEQQPTSRHEWPSATT